MKPFNDLVILEFSSVLAGPSVGLFFEELGAEVIKIENELTNGDITRQWKLKSEDPKSAYSAYYASINSGKQIKLKNLKLENHYQEIVQLVKRCDIVIVNFKHGDDKKLRLDFQTLSKIKPDIIYGQISGYGLEDDKVAFDMILQAECGYIGMCGSPGSPAKMPVALIDILAGHQLKEGILCALYQRKNKAQHIHVSLYDTAIASLANQASNYLNENHIPLPLGTLHPNIAPYGEIYLSKDDVKFTIGIGSEKQFERLIEIFKMEIMSKAFSSNQLRLNNRDSLNNLLQLTFKKYDFSIITSKLSNAFIPHSEVKSLQNVFENPKTARLIRTFNFGERTYKSVRSVVFEQIKYS
jgi:crotonobetainyl-CoA:carnitine CoA-transferase CaiB-like acyl-CoA transferase